MRPTEARLGPMKERELVQKLAWYGLAGGSVYLGHARFGLGWLAAAGAGVVLATVLVVVGTLVIDRVGK